MPRRKTPAWATAPAKYAPPGICGSWPHCEAPVDEGGRFCGEHQAILDRVAATFRRPARQGRPIPGAAQVKVSHVQPRPAGESKTQMYRRLILEALKGGAMNSVELAKACRTNTHNRTYSRVRGDLEHEHLIQYLGREGRQLRYGLAEAAVAA